MNLATAGVPDSIDGHFPVGYNKTQSNVDQVLNRVDGLAWSTIQFKTPVSRSCELSGGLSE